MTTNEMSNFINSLWCWSRCTDEEQRKLAEIADYLSNRGNEKSALDNVRAEIKGITPTYHNPDWSITDLAPISEVLKILDKYKAESEG